MPSTVAASGCDANETLRVSTATTHGFRWPHSAIAVVACTRRLKKMASVIILRY